MRIEAQLGFDPAISRFRAPDGLSVAGPLVGSRTAALRLHDGRERQRNGVATLLSQCTRRVVLAAYCACAAALDMLAEHGLDAHTRAY